MIFYLQYDDDAPYNNQLPRTVRLVHSCQSNDISPHIHTHTALCYLFLKLHCPLILKREKYSNLIGNPQYERQFLRNFPETLGKHVPQTHFGTSFHEESGRESEWGCIDTKTGYISSRNSIAWVVRRIYISVCYENCVRGNFLLPIRVCVWRDVYR